MNQYLILIDLFASDLNQFNNIYKQIEMDDDDNDEYEQEEDEDDTNIRSYSKKKHFGKLSRDLRMFNVKLYYRLKGQFLKPFKFTAQGGKANTNEPFGSSAKFKIQHKKDYDDFKTKTTLNFNLKKYLEAYNLELNSKLTKKIGQSSFSLQNQIKQNLNLTSKITHNLSIWQKLKVKYGLQFEKKGDNILGGGNANLQFKQTFKDITFFPFITQYTHLLSVGTSLRSKKQQNYNAVYKSHFITKDSHKAYLEHKTTFDPNTKNASPWTHTLAFNCQDAQAIGTINTSLQIQQGKIKSKQARFVIQYDKKYRFGVQKRNQIFQFMIQRYKIKQRFMKSIKLYAGNKGFLGVVDGKLNFSRLNLDYTLNFKLKPGGGNFYNDSSMGASLKWNI